MNQIAENIIKETQYKCRINECSVKNDQVYFESKYRISEIVE